MKRLPQLGSIAEIKFYDHGLVERGTDSDVPICTVWGRLVSNNKIEIRVRTWETMMDNKRDTDNHEETIIVKSAIIDSRRLA